MDNAQQLHNQPLTAPAVGRKLSLAQLISDDQYPQQDSDFLDLSESMQALDDLSDDTLEELDSELSQLLSITEGAGLFLLVGLINRLVFAPVETVSGEVLIQPLILSLIAEKCGSPHLLETLNIRCRYNRSILNDSLLNFSLEPEWYPWLSPEHAFYSPQTRIFEEAGKRVTLKYMDDKLVAVKTLSMRGPFFDKKALPKLGDVILVCIQAISRYLWNKTGGGIKSLSRKTANFSQTDDTIKLVFGQNEFSRAELDLGFHLSKPYVPWLGKSLDVSYLGESKQRFGSIKKGSRARAVSAE